MTEQQTTTNPTKEQIEAAQRWLASRKEAGRKIDVETCEVKGFYCGLNDPYGLRTDLSEEEMTCCSVKYDFVRSPDSDGWIVSDDLPPEKQEALDARIARIIRETGRAG